MSVEPHAPYACSLLPRELNQRRQEVLHQLRAKVLRIEETPEGYDFLFPPTAALETELAEFVRFEASCCAFIQMNVVAEPAALRLRMTGDPEARPFMCAEFVAETGTETGALEVR